MAELISEGDEPTQNPTPTRKLVRMAGLASLLFLIAIGLMGYEVYLRTQKVVPIVNPVALKELSSQQTTLAQQILDLQSAIAQLPKAESAINPILSRIEALETRPAPTMPTAPIDTLTERLNALEAAQKQFAQQAAATPPNAVLLKMAALNGLELALSNNRPFAMQLEQVKAQFPATNIDPALTQFASKGLPQASEFLAELTANEKALFERIAPAPQDWWEAFQRSISRWVVVEKAGQLHSSPAAVVDQITRALKANDWPRLAQLWQGIPPEARTITPQLNAAISARASANMLITDSWQGLKP